MKTKFKFLVEEDEVSDYSNERTIMKEIAYQLKRIADNTEKKTRRG